MASCGVIDVPSTASLLEDTRANPKPVLYLRAQAPIKRTRSGCCLLREKANKFQPELGWKPKPALRIPISAHIDTNNKARHECSLICMAK